MIVLPRNSLLLITQLRNNGGGTLGNLDGGARTSFRNTGEDGGTDFGPSDANVVGEGEEELEWEGVSGDGV